RRTRNAGRRELQPGRELRGHPRVLTEDRVRLPERARSPRREIFEIADGRADDDETPRRITIRHRPEIVRVVAERCAAEVRAMERDVYLADVKRVRGPILVVLLAAAVAAEIVDWIPTRVNDAAIPGRDA